MLVALTNHSFPDKTRQPMAKATPRRGNTPSINYLSAHIAPIPRMNNNIINIFIWVFVACTRRIIIGLFSLSIFLRKVRSRQGFLITAMPVGDSEKNKVLYQQHKAVATHCVKWLCFIARDYC